MANGPTENTNNDKLEAGIILQVPHNHEYAMKTDAELQCSRNYPQEICKSSTKTNFIKRFC